MIGQAVDHRAPIPLAGALAPPSANGETVFDAPWQGRVFGMAHVLVDAGLFSWDDFRIELIAAIGAHDPAVASIAAPPGTPDVYWSHFLCALESVLDRLGLAPAAVVASRVSHMADRPEGHDHLGHDHLGHDHSSHHHEGHHHEGHDHSSHHHEGHRHPHD